MAHPLKGLRSKQHLLQHIQGWNLGSKAQRAQWLVLGPTSSLGGSDAPVMGPKAILESFYLLGMAEMPGVW